MFQKTLNCKGCVVRNGVRFVLSGFFQKKKRTRGGQLKVRVEVKQGDAKLVCTGDDWDSPPRKINQSDHLAGLSAPER